ncbi:MAG: SoxR reducing system RseC family protein [Treponema sp.]|jgi:hypothetical protein|nr:SoxR reducing system RseC family protein [Treponema sp.]
MRDKAVITSVSNSGITVIPLITNACLGCSEGCAKRGKPFPVSNPQKFAVTPGTVVKIGAPVKIMIFQGFFSILFPILCAAGGYFATAPLASFFRLQPTEGLHAGCILLFLALSYLTVYVLSRNQTKIVKSEILEIC